MSLVFDNAFYLMIILIGAVAFRVRGGGWFTFNSDTICRFIWGFFGLSVPYSVLLFWKLFQGKYIYLGQAIYTAILIPLAFLAMSVPHAAYQNMGRWNTPQKTWPGFFLPTVTQQQWDSMPMWLRTSYDFCGMIGVGFFRGLIAFCIYATISWKSAAISVCIITILQPISYLFGRFMPINLTSSLPSRSASWGEFFNGAAWVIALCAL